VFFQKKEFQFPYSWLYGYCWSFFFYNLYYGSFFFGFWTNHNIWWSNHSCQNFWYGDQGHLDWLILLDLGLISSQLWTLSEIQNLSWNGGRNRHCGFLSNKTKNTKPIFFNNYFVICFCWYVLIVAIFTLNPTPEFWTPNPWKISPPKDQEITVRKLNLIWMFLSGLQNKNWKHSYKIIVQNLILRAKHKKKPLT